MISRTVLTWKMIVKICKQAKLKSQFFMFYILYIYIGNIQKDIGANNMSEWGVNFNGKVSTNGTDVPKKVQTEQSDYVSVPMTNGVETTIETPWAKMMGVDIKKENDTKEALFSNEDLAAFVAPYLENTDEFTAVTAAESVQDVTDEQFYAFENVVPEESKGHYAGHHVDGTANRIYGMGIASNDVADITGGDPELLDIAGLLFQDAEYQKEVS